jgi:alpha-ketoglutarate-dependent taurine dioxygenase
MSEPLFLTTTAPIGSVKANPEGTGTTLIGPPLSPAGGVFIEGVDAAEPMSAALRDRLFAAFCNHHVVVFRNQILSREQQFAFMANFGEVEHSKGRQSANKRYGVAHVISNLDLDGRPVDRSASAVSNYNWHTDKPYYRAPPMMTALYAVEMPPHGGDTEFANTALAYSALKPEVKNRIAGKRVVFYWGAAQRDREGPVFAGSEAEAAVDHPLVRTHPHTGARALYLGNHSSHILGWPPAEGRALLDELLAHTTQREFVYAHRWEVGDLVMWDNRCLLHRAVANFDIGKHRRILHRTVIRGTVPF